jgi:IMP and pyridine-specific 5'-nucleotidase
MRCKKQPNSSNQHISFVRLRFAFPGRFVCISFNEIRHILNLAQIIAMINPYSQGETWEVPSRSAGSLVGTKFYGNDGAAEEARGKLGSKGHPERPSETDARVLEAWKSMGEDENVDDATASSCDNNKSRKKQTSASPPRQSVNRRDRSESIAIEENLSLLPSSASMPGPKLICFDGDQTLYSDGANFEKSPKLAKYIYLLLKHGVTIAVVTAAGYEYQAAKYELRLSGLLAYFRERGLEGGDLERFYIFGGECNYLLRLGDDYQLHAVREDGPGGWVNSTKYLVECPGNWNEVEIKSILDRAEACFQTSLTDQNMRATIIRKKRSVGLIPKVDEKIPREALDETVLRIQTELEEAKVSLPFCAFNGGRDAWVDVGNKRVGVQVLQSYLGIPAEETLHIGDQFLLTGNDFAARSVCPCVWITSPEETTYILKSILRLAGVPLMALMNPSMAEEKDATGQQAENGMRVDFEEAGRRSTRFKMDVYTGEYINANL